MLRIVILSRREKGSGAHNAANRYHKAISLHGREYGIESFLCVVNADDEGDGVISGYPKVGIWRATVRNMRFVVLESRKCLYKLLGGRVLHSCALVETGMVDRVTSLQPDLVLVNWLGDYTVALEELDALTCPVILRNGDEWFFSGCAHFPVRDSVPESKRRYQEVLADLFFKKASLRALDRKRALFPDLVSATVSPSPWMASRAAASGFFGDIPHYVMANPMNTDFWHPPVELGPLESKRSSSEKLILGFGAVNATTDPRKGFDLLAEAARFVAREDPLVTGQLRLEVFGAKSGPANLSGIPVSYHGDLSPSSLRGLFGELDLLLVPSRTEGFPNIAAEAQSCGLPVLAFEVGGASEIIENRVTGFLVEGQDPASFGSAVIRVARNRQVLCGMGRAARLKALSSSEKHFVAKFSQIAKQVVGT